MNVRRCLIALLLAGLASATVAAAVMPSEPAPAAALARAEWPSWCHNEAKPWVGADLCAFLGGPR